MPTQKHYKIVRTYTSNKQYSMESRSVTNTYEEDKAVFLHINVIKLICYTTYSSYKYPYICEIESDIRIIKK